MTARRAFVPAALALALAAAPAQAATFYVAFNGGDDTNPGTDPTLPLETIQGGVDKAAAANDGNDVINVEAGTFNAGADQAIDIPDVGTLDVLGLLGGWNSDFSARTPRSTIFIPQQPPSLTDPDVHVDDGNVTIDGFTFDFDGDGTRQGGGLEVNDANITINNNLFEAGSSSSPTAGDAHALDAPELADLGTFVVSNNTFHANAANDANAIQLESFSAAEVRLANNQISGSSLDFGVFLHEAGNVTISGSSVTGAAVGVLSEDLDGPLAITGSSFSGNDEGVVVTNTGSSAPPPQPVTLTDVTATGNVFEGFFIQHATAVALSNVEVEGNGQGGFVSESGSVSVTDSRFEQNGTEGLNLQAIDGSVDLTGGAYNGNAEQGIEQAADGGELTLRGATVSGNDSHGLLLRAPAGQIGGPDAGQGNTISGNGGAGIALEPSATANIERNSISGNGALAIDLGADGVTANDAGDGDTGANALQNFPALVLAQQGQSTRLTGNLNSRPSTEYRLELFSQAACDGSGNGEAETFLGAASVTTDAAGNAPIDAVVAPTVPLGQVVTATATDVAAGATSELSGCTPVTAPPAGPAADTVVPALTSFAMDTRFRAASSGGSIAQRRRAPVGTTVTYTLSEVAAVTFTVRRARPGRRVRGRCVRPRRSNRRRPRCRRYVRRGSFTHQGQPGQNSFRFTGRLNGRKLRRGRYRLVAVARDAAGNASTRQRRNFRIVR